MKMKDSQNTQGSQDTQGKDSSHDMLMKFLQHPEMLRQKLQNFIDEEKEVFGDSINEISELSNYVVSNWRQIVPPVVAFGLSVLLKRNDPVKMATPANDVKDHTLLN